VSNSVYCRFPDIHADDVVFVADDDIWLGPASGGRAQRLTADHAACVNPCFSPDGAYIAWTSTRAGESDTYLLDRASGAIRRLTWFGLSSLVVGWLDDAHVLVASGHQEVFPGLRRLYSVALDGTWQKLPLGPAMAGAWGPDGAIAVVTPNNRDSAYWKRYRGGTAGALWCQASPSDEWREILPEEPAGKYAPCWVGGRLAFTSDLGAGRGVIDDPHAQAQVWSVDANGGELRQHTHHTMLEGYARDARSDGRRVVYHALGAIYLLDGLDSEPRALDFDLGVNAPAPEQLEVSSLGSIAVDAKGTGSLVEWHGAAFFLTHRAGPARSLVADPAVRVRLSAMLGDSGNGIVVTEAEGEDALEVLPLDGLGDHHRLASGKLGRVLELAAAPNGSEVAVASHDGKVIVVDVASGDVQQVGHVAQGDATGLAWSPDSRYLAWAEWLGDDGVDAGRVCCVDRQTPGDPAMALTSGAFADSCPAFTRDGKHLAWLSRRNFDPHYNDFGFDLAFSAATRVFLAPLSATEVAPFGVSADGWPLADDKDEAKDKKSQKGGVTCQLDVEGFEARALALPVPAGRYEDLAAVAGGLVWLRSPDRGGELGSTWAGTKEPPADVLEWFSFTSRKTEVLADKADDFAVSGDGQCIVVAHKDELIVIPSDRKLDDDDDARVKVDLARLRRSVDRRAQWRQMFDENGRLMASHFWREDMDGTDWNAVLASYRPVIDRAMTNTDVYDILYECVAELNTGHSYIIPADSEPSPLATGYLGVETKPVDDGLEIVRILPSQSGDPKAWSPLLAAGVGAQAGDVIAAVDGRPTAGVPDIGVLLEGAAGQTVELTLRRGGQAPRRVAVVTLRSEAALRYHDWVATRAAYVEKASGGRLGYVHVPDMMSVGWAQLERMLGQARAHEGVLADMRYNRGGHTSQLVIDRLTQRVLGWDVIRHYATPSTYPAQGMRGPVVVLANQWSGSDGDIVTAASKLHGLTVVGMRTWGGVIGIDSRYDLVDGTVVTQPRYSSWFEHFGWGIENYGIDPDVEVKLTPGDWQSEDDAQLDVAIEVALQQLAEHPAAEPPVLPPPRFH